MQTADVKLLIKEITELKDLLNQKSKEIENLEHSNSFLQKLFNEIHEEIIVIGPDFVIHDVNKFFLDHYGLKKEDVLGKKCYEITSRLDGPCQFGNEPCQLEKARKTGKRVEVTHYHEAENGGFKEVLRIIYPLAVSRKGPEYFVEISRDVTEQRDLIRKIKASEKKFRTILDTATDAILSIDEEHRIVLFNNAAQRIFGYSRSEVLGKDLNMLIPSKYGDHYRLVKRFLETRKPKVMGDVLSLTALRKGGEEFAIELSLSYFEIHGRITFAAIIRDVSDQKQLEKKLLRSERLAAVGKAVAHVAHEIKNPLMIIGGFSDQIRRNVTDKNAMQKLDMILDEVNRLENLIEDLGDFTKQYKLIKRRADVNSVIMDVLKIMKGIYSSEKYNFKADLNPDLPEINCDPDKLKQVYMNVITNGIEAMEDGGTIRISTDKWLHGVEIRISDEGSGISEKDLLHIFEPFYTTRAKGSGLGLSISYKIIEVHNGDIWAVSMPGKGTTFVIRLPDV